MLRRYGFDKSEIVESVQKSLLLKICPIPFVPHPCPEWGIPQFGGGGKSQNIDALLLLNFKLRNISYPDKHSSFYLWSSVVICGHLWMITFILS